MNNENVSFAGNKVSVRDMTLTVEHPVIDAFRMDDKIIVLYDPRAKPHGDFQNLVAFGTDGRQLWAAEVGEGWFYYRVKREKPLLAYAPSYRYEIDLEASRRTSRRYRRPTPSWPSATAPRSTTGRPGRSAMPTRGTSKSTGSGPMPELASRRMSE